MIVTIMKKITLLLLLWASMNSHLIAQEDSPETLNWANSQAQKIDTILQNAILSSNQLSLVYNILDAYVLYDAVFLAGLYCPNARAAAAEGRNQCDIRNFKFDKDLNSLILRATIARQIAFQLSAAAKQCSPTNANAKNTGFSPKDVLKKDIEMIQLDLSDGLASGDMHLLAQKTTHAIRILRDIQHLSYTLDNCKKVEALAHDVIEYCEAALKSKYLQGAAKQISLAVRQLEGMGGLPCD
jgi:hypothetical protein